MTSIDELHQMLLQGENAEVEFEAEPSEEVLRGLSTRIAAFANSQGGTLIFGVTDRLGPQWNYSPKDLAPFSSLSNMEYPSASAWS